MGRHAAVLVLIAGLAVSLAGCGDGNGDSDAGGATTAPVDSDADIDDLGCPVVEAPPSEALEVGVVVEHEDDGTSHISCAIAYDRSPPSSGPHFHTWQNCLFYDESVRDYTAVHALEHGAVWIAYRDDVDPVDLAEIEGAVQDSTHLLAAPYPGLQNPIVLTAWTRQMAVDSWDDPAVARFLDDHTGRRSPTAPEAGVSCEGAIGSSDDPDANYAGILAEVS